MISCKRQQNKHRLVFSKHYLNRKTILSRKIVVTLIDTIILPSKSMFLNHQPSHSQFFEQAAMTWSLRKKQPLVNAVF